MRIKALTLIEIIIVMVIVGILSVGFGWYFTNVFDTWRTSSNRDSLTNDLVFCMQHMGRNIRQIVNRDIREAGAQTLSFSMWDSDDNTVIVRYRFDNGSILYELDNLPQDAPDGVFDVSSPLLDNVTNLQFTYFDIYGEETTFIGNISSIKVVITVARDGEEVSMEAEFSIRSS